MVYKTYCFDFCCNKKAHSLLGQCGYCSKYYCMKHRLPEKHNCVNLYICKEEAFKENKKILKRQKCVNNKINKKLIN